MKPIANSSGLSSQTNGAQQLPGTYKNHPMPSNMGKNASYECNPLMGSTGGKSSMKTGKSK